MTRHAGVADPAKFDAMQLLGSRPALAAHLTGLIADGDAGVLAAALGRMARARGMAQVASDTGLAREALYRALRPGSHPSFDTITRVCAALGVKLVAQPIYPAA
jgi:probable addiction module antidote protein